MFTFGRDHEKKHAVRYVRDAAQAALITRLIDVAHDLSEGVADQATFMEAARTAFVEGGSGVWEAAGSWIRKVGQDFPSILTLWPDLAGHPQATVRFRVACHLSDMPAQLSAALGEELLKDRSKKVAQMAAARLTGQDAT